MKPKLLIIELWGLGDLVIATPFLRAAVEKFDVTLVAKPYAQELQPRFWPGVRVLPFTAPWTAFKRKYIVWRWPWRAIREHRAELLAQKFDLALSGRWDPRDHYILARSGARRRIGFPRVGSGIFLTTRLGRPAPNAHRYEFWRVLAGELGLVLPPRDNAFAQKPSGENLPLLVHSGAAQPVRVWPLDRYFNLVKQLRAQGRRVTVACDADQLDSWQRLGETDAVAPKSVTELLALLDRSSAFIGNDSGPGHLAAVCGLPTFSIFGPQLSEWFAPLQRHGVTIEGKPCPFKPCSDYCRFETAHCIRDISEREVAGEVAAFLKKNFP